MFYLDFEHKLESIEKDKKTFLKSTKLAGSQLEKKILSFDNKLNKEHKRIYSHLSPWQIVKIARHPSRPKTLDYIKNIFTDFIKLSGDRLFSDDHAVVSGLAKIDGNPVIIIGTEKGFDMETRIQHNFGMAKPEGYRKAQRMMRLAEKFQIPLICFIDTSGAYPGKEAEERGQAESIAKSMQVALNIKTPSISIVIGEGGSGGAIAIGTSDKVLMFTNSIYSVISPEGCASILWKSANFSEDAANSLKLTAKDCLNLKIIDEIIEEPLLGAHNDPTSTFKILKNSIVKNLNELKDKNLIDLIKKRNQRYLNYIL